MVPTQVLLRPILTEKTSREEAKGLYTFIVAQGATKIDIKNAVMVLYGVSVRAVTVRPTPEKVRIVGRGRKITKRNHVKKATINFGPGVKIDLYKFSTHEAKRSANQASKGKEKSKEKRGSSAKKATAAA